LSQYLADLLKKDGFYNSADAQKMANWNPYDQTKPSDFFDAYWMFGVENGFDMVIGNPPYVQLQNNHGELADKYKDCNYTTFTRTGDMYQLFYEQGTNLLNRYGYLCFITSNKWMRAGYGETTRKFLTQNAQTIQLIDFSGQRVFESATVDVNIILLKKREQTQYETNACVIREDCLNNMTDYIRQAETHVSFPKDGKSWVILSDIEQQIKAKIEKVGTPLKDWDINIYRGILTGCNEAFIIDKTKRDELIKKDSKSAEIIHPFHIKLDERTKTTGVVLCDQARTLDIKARNCEFIELIPDDILLEIVDIIIGFIEIENEEG
jgi:methylase of polypeptide subunit release factors